MDSGCHRLDGRWRWLGVPTADIFISASKFSVLWPVCPLSPLQMSKHLRLVSLTFFPNFFPFWCLQVTLGTSPPPVCFVKDLSPVHRGLKPASVQCIKTSLAEFKARLKLHLSWFPHNNQYLLISCSALVQKRNSWTSTGIKLQLLN